jgi:hypothetical protein
MARSQQIELKLGQALRVFSHLGKLEIGGLADELEFEHDLSTQEREGTSANIISKSFHPVKEKPISSVGFRRSERGFNRNDAMKSPPGFLTEHTWQDTYIIYALFPFVD